MLACHIDVRTNPSVWNCLGDGILISSHCTINECTTNGSVDSTYVPFHSSRHSTSESHLQRNNIDELLLIGRTSYWFGFRDNSCPQPAPTNQTAIYLTPNIVHYTYRRQQIHSVQIFIYTRINKFDSSPTYSSPIMVFEIRYHALVQRLKYAGRVLR